MIVMRIEGSGIQGGCTIHGGEEMNAKYAYGDPSVGWFPIESASFGFESPSKAEDGGGNSSGGQAQNRGNAGQSRGRVGTAQRPGSGQSGGSENESRISIGKHADAATVTLMLLTMADRKKRKPGEDNTKDLAVDIHLLDSVMKQDDKKSRYVFPYMMIHLQKVMVRNWNVQAQGDDRPQESLELWFDKVAVRYYKTVDGSVWTLAGCEGWDQVKNEKWSPKVHGDASLAKYFLEEPSTV